MTTACTRGPHCVGERHGWDCPASDPLADLRAMIGPPLANPILEQVRRDLVDRWFPLPKEEQMKTLPEDAACPLPGCGKPLYLAITLLVPITDETTTRPETATVNDGWEVLCEEDHRLAAGSHDMDGRTTLHGYRVGQVLGGVR